MIFLLKPSLPPEPLCQEWPHHFGASQVAPVVKNLPAKAGDTRDAVRSLSWEDPVEYKSGNPLHHSCLKNSMAKRSLVIYHPWGCKDWDTTEWLSTHTPHPTVYRMRWNLRPTLNHYHLPCFTQYNELSESKTVLLSSFSPVSSTQQAFSDVEWMHERMNELL